MTCGPRTTSSPTAPTGSSSCAGGLVHDAGLGVGQRQADRARAVAAVDRVDVRHRAGLRQAVALDDVLRAVALELLGAPSAIERRSPGDDGADERQVARLLAQARG